MSIEQELTETRTQLAKVTADRDAALLQLREIAEAVLCYYRSQFSGGDWNILIRHINPHLPGKRALK